MPPTPKAVLICLADYADDQGQCWPSIDTITQFTCFGRTAVITAIRWLEDHGAVNADRTNGRHTAYQVTPDQYACRTGTPPGPVRLPNKPVREADGTSTGGGLYPSGRRTLTTNNHQEPPIKATTKHVVAIELPAWLPKSAWRDWCDHRKAIKSAMTPKAAELSIAKLAEYRERGIAPELVINNAIERGWRGLYPPHGQGPPAAGKPSAAADFRGKTYDATPIDQLPPDLRAAVERALRDD